MKFSVFQIQVDRTPRSVDQELPESVTAWRDASMGWTFLQKHYGFKNAEQFAKKVAIVDANDEEEVFELMNLWNDPDRVTKLTDKVRSLSVGDYLVTEDGEMLFCDSVGFVKFSKPID